MDFQIRRPQEGDLSRLINLYRSAASLPNGLARSETEITEQFVRDLLADTHRHGLLLVVEEPVRGELIGAIHAKHSETESLRHVMGQLTILVRPDKHSMGIGRRLFQEFLSLIQKDFRFILRVELRARAANVRALRFYRSLGFLEEGRFRSRIRMSNGQFDDGIPMVWFNPAWHEPAVGIDRELDLGLNPAQA